MPTKKKEPTRSNKGEDWSEATEAPEAQRLEVPTGPETSRDKPGDPSFNDDDNPPTFQDPVQPEEVKKEEPTLARDDAKPGEQPPEVDPNREASVGEVVANHQVEETKGDLAPMQPTETTGQKAPEPQAAPTKERKFIVSVGRLGSFRYGQEVTQSQLKVGDTDLNRLLREGAVSEPNPSK
jgi:hypothetical protein